VLYFSFDLHREPEALYDVVRRAKALHPDAEGPWYLFLDEVTSVPRWQRGVTVAWDQGLTRDDFLLLTGSSAHDVKYGAEQLPGRRGSGADFLHLPMSFRDFCMQVEELPLPAETFDIEGSLGEDGRRLARQLRPRPDGHREAAGGSSDGTRQPAQVGGCREGDGDGQQPHRARVRGAARGSGMRVSPSRERSAKGWSHRGTYSTLKAPCPSSPSRCCSPGCRKHPGGRWGWGRCRPL